MKIGLAMVPDDKATLKHLVDEIVQAEIDGFPSVWVANIFSLDALTVLALAGERTSKIELGTAVVPTYPRHPHALAQQAATVNVACGGRLALGVGRSHQIVIENMFGIPYSTARCFRRPTIRTRRSERRASWRPSAAASEANSPARYRKYAPSHVLDRLGTVRALAPLGYPRRLERDGHGAVSSRYFSASPSTRMTE